MSPGDRLAMSPGDRFAIKDYADCADSLFHLLVTRHIDRENQLDADKRRRERINRNNQRTPRSSVSDF